MLRALLLILCLLPASLAAPAFADPPGETPSETTHISSGEYHTCALTPAGDATCWGFPAAEVPGPFTQITARSSYSCALTLAGDAVCWGTGPAASGHSGPFTQISAGNEHACALTPEGDLTCWGSNFLGQAPPFQSGPFSQVSSGSFHTCALTAAGAATCWGANWYDQAPALVEGPFTQISAGSDHTCALTPDGDLTCWGSNAGGRAPAFESGPFTQITASGWHTCALTAEGDATCWGPDFYGEAPALVDGPFTEISAGGHHTCALDDSHQVTCWGWNYYGQAPPVPDTTIDSGPGDGSAASSTSADFTFSTDVAFSTFSCKLDDGDWTPCDSGSQSYDGLSESSHTFSVRARNGAGHTDATPASRTWSVDTTPPDTVIDSGPTGMVSSATADFTFSSPEAGSTFECKLDSGPYASCTSPRNLTGVTAGSHTFSVRAVDLAGNTDPTPASATWSVGGTNQLAVTRSGAGAGTVRTSPAWINCGGTCTTSYAFGAAVTLTATASSGSYFNGWGGACSGTAPTCSLTMDEVRSVTADFELREPLSVTKPGAGAGTVRSATYEINCGGTCTAGYIPDTVVTLTATPASGSYFNGWGGACSGTATTCSVTMEEAQSVSADFELKEPLSVTKPGTGAGTVKSVQTGINCGGTCTTSYLPDTVVTLTATAASGSYFNGWAGACSGTAATCSVTMDAAQSVIANFQLKEPLSVTKPGTGAGTVKSAPAGINCGGTCTAAYVTDTVVTLTATAASGSYFNGWGGACSGTAATCSVTMEEAQSVSADFQLKEPLAVTRSGAGTGTVKSATAEINCGGTCTASYLPGTVVTLTATPASSSYFNGWAGACSGTAATCSVTMEEAQSVSADFELKEPLAVTRSGAGAGTVKSVPAGINCGGTCTTGYVPGTMVTLTATPASGSYFNGWGGACSGTSATCSVTMEEAQSVSADFQLKQPLAVTKSGAGTGTVKSAPAGINCGGTCTAAYVPGTVVTLTATPASGSYFNGWGGACSGTATTCSVTLDEAQSVSADFVPVGGS